MLSCGLNFPLAMVLAAYTEIIGSVYNEKIGLHGFGCRNYQKMLNLMGYSQIEIDFETAFPDVPDNDPYHIIRCGLIHQFITKQKAHIDVDFPDSHKGIEIRAGIIYISNKKYFEEFKIAVNKIIKEMNDNSDKKQRINSRYNSNYVTMVSGQGPVIIQSK